MPLRQQGAFSEMMSSPWLSSGRINLKIPTSVMPLEKKRNWWYTSYGDFSTQMCLPVSLISFLRSLTLRGPGPRATDSPVHLCAH